VDRLLITVTEIPCFTINDDGCVDTGTDAREGHCDRGVEIRVLNANARNGNHDTLFLSARPQLRSG